jgi:hypothetical protein
MRNQSGAAPLAFQRQLSINPTVLQSHLTEARGDASRTGASVIDDAYSVDLAREEFMRNVMALAAAVGALAGIQAVAATPAAAGYCSPYYHGYYYARPCCPRYYAPVRYYRPIRTVTYYRVVGYRPAPLRHWRSCCR